MLGRQGTTLVEILVATFIGTILLIAGFEILQQAAKAYQRSASDYQSYSELQNVASWIIRDTRRHDAQDIYLEDAQGASLDNYGGSLTVGRSLVVGSDKFSFGENGLEIYTNGAKTLTAGVTGSFTVSEYVYSKVITVNAATSGEQRSLQMSATVYKKSK